MNNTKREAIFARFEQANPTPTTELEYASVFQLLIAVILSAQATDKSVNLATRALFKSHGTPQKMLALGVTGLTPYIKTIGLFRTKAKNVIATCQALVEQHKNEIPRSREALEALPGVGRKTANVVLNTAFGEPTMAVDTHIYRVSNRTGIAPGKTVLAVEKHLRNLCPLSTSSMPITGSFSMAVMSAWPAHQSARSVPLPTCATTNKKTKRQPKRQPKSQPKRQWSRK